MARDVAPAVLGDALDVLDVVVAHALAADIAGVQELAVVVVLAQALTQALVFLRRLHRLERHSFLQGRELGVPLQHLEARVDEMDAVVDGLELGRLVHDVHRRGDLAAVVQQARDLELVAVLVAHVEVLERAVAGFVDGLGEKHGEHRHALAVAAGVRRLLVDRAIDEVDERLEQLLELVDQHPVGERDRRLRGERFRQALVGRGKRHDRAAARVLRIDQLQHADRFAFVVAHRHREKRLRAVAGLGVEGAGAREIEALGGVGVGDVDRLAGERGVRRHHAVVRSAVLVELDRVERHRVAGGAAEVVLEGAGAHDLEAQALLLGDAVERAAVGAGDRLGRRQDCFEQPVDVALGGQRGADGVELIETLDQVVGGSERRAGGEAQALGAVDACAHGPSARFT